MRRTGTVLAVGVLTAGLAVIGTASASAYTIPYQQSCESHGTRTWGTPGGGSIVIPTTQVEYGSTGDCVAYAQELLSFSGYTISVDGSFGPQTQSALLSFQRSKLSISACGPADGVVGPRTWMCLEFQN